jgi:hypothetical protein
MPTVSIPTQRQGITSWTHATPLPDDGVLYLPESAVAEIVSVAEILAAHPLPTEALQLSEFDMPTAYAAMKDLRETLTEGPGFAIIDRIPVEQMSTRVATQVYWLLMSALGRPVAQKWDGTMVYDVTDTGSAPAPGNGVRSSKSNRGQGYHTDNAFNTPPDVVGLFCLRPAMEGGLSGLVSMDSVYNRLLETFPDNVHRLFESFMFDRQREHAPDDPVVYNRPMFEVSEGEVEVCLSTDLVRQAHGMTNTPLDDATHGALEALDTVMEDPALGKTFDFEPGQIQIVNNRRIGHRRTAFTDWPDNDEKRHLVRIWLRERGRRSYHG